MPDAAAFRLRFRIVAAVLILLFAGACAETQFVISGAKRLSGLTDGPDSRVGKGHYKIGNPYQIAQVWYYPKVDYRYSETGIASWYGPNFDGKPTANGEIFDMNQVTAAHRTLPLPSIVRVTNLSNGRSIKVRVNDRGPFAHGRIIDLSRRSAQLLGFEMQGTAKVEVTLLEAESRQVAAEYGQKNDVPEMQAQAPPPVAAPRVAVTSASLAPPPGTYAAPPPNSNHAIVPVQDAPARALRQQAVAPVVSEEVTIVPVSSGNRIYVQAGAFGRFDNANRMRAILSPIGNVRIHQVENLDRPLFRVRFGPLQSVEEADKMLEAVLRSGQRNARIVVD
ncbi:MAG: septal ring lytic transglycosylase RlpA family protein [Alphaproteobacteria bacterium]